MSEETSEYSPAEGLPAVVFGWKTKRALLRDPPFDYSKPKFTPDYSAAKRKKKLQRRTYAPEGGTYAVDILIVKRGEFNWMLNSSQKVG
jgi:hypothetical protein